METNSKKHIDLSYLKELSNGSNDFIMQIISVFLEQTPEAINKMEKCLQTSDWDGLRATAHKIKPSLLFMGIKELADDINAVEQYSAAKINLDKLPGMVSKIKTICMEAIQELEIEKKAFL